MKKYTADDFLIDVQPVLIEHKNTRVMMIGLAMGVIAGVLAGYLYWGRRRTMAEGV